MTNSHSLWSRVLTFIPMPTSDDGESINEGMLRRLIDFQIDNGVDGIVVFGSTGGFSSFTHDEMKRATAIVADHARGRAVVVAGTGARTTSACIDLTAHAQKVGCAGALIIPTSYWPLNQDEVYAHYSKLSSEIDIPICLYNNPWTTGFDMKPDFLAHLAELKNISCIKESTADPTRVTEIRLRTGDKLSILAGWETQALDALTAGADGWASACSNLVPRECRKFFEVAMSGVLAKAREHWQKLFPLCDFITQKTHIRVVHSGLELLGLKVGQPRRPLRSLGTEATQQLKAVLRASGLST